MLMRKAFSSANTTDVSSSNESSSRNRTVFTRVITSASGRRAESSAGAVSYVSGSTGFWVARLVFHVWKPRLHRLRKNAGTEGDRTGPVGSPANAGVAAAFLRNCWQYRRIRSSPFGDLRPTGYRRRFCCHSSAASKVGGFHTCMDSFASKNRSERTHNFVHLNQLWHGY